MSADNRFVRDFARALETVRLEDEADLFQRVLDIARERHDDVLAGLATQYRDRATQRARLVRRTATEPGSSADTLIDLARVAARHPTHLGQQRPPLAAV